MAQPGVSGRKHQGRLEVDPWGFGAGDTKDLTPAILPLKKRFWQHMKAFWAASEVVGTEAQLLLAPRLPVLGWMFKERVPSTHHATYATWTKWVALITLTQTGQTKQGTRYHVPSCWVPVGELAEGGRESRLGTALGIGWWELRSAFRCLFCVFSLSVLLLLFTHFAVLLDCPYPDPWVFAFFFPPPPHPSGGRVDRATMWPFVAGHGPEL